MRNVVPLAILLLTLPATSCAGPRPTAPAAQSETLFLDGRDALSRRVLPDWRVLAARGVIRKMETARHRYPAGGANEPRSCGLGSSCPRRRVSHHPAARRQSTGSGGPPPIHRTTSAARICWRGRIGTNPMPPAEPPRGHPPSSEPTRNGAGLTRTARSF